MFLGSPCAYERAIRASPFLLRLPRPFMRPQHASPRQEGTWSVRQAAQAACRRARCQAAVDMAEGAAAAAAAAGGPAAGRRQQQQPAALAAEPSNGNGASPPQPPQQQPQQQGAALASESSSGNGASPPPPEQQQQQQPEPPRAPPEWWGAGGHPKVAVLTTLGCPYCKRAKAALAAAGVPYEELDLTDQPEALALVKQLTGQSTVPQVGWGVGVGGARGALCSFFFPCCACSLWPASCSALPRLAAALPGWRPAAGACCAAL